MRSALLILLLFAATAARADSPPELRFRIDLGGQTNLFQRRGPVAAHVVLRAGRTPRLIVAFPAGDSGVGVWLGPAPASLRWSVGPLAPVSTADARGRALFGVEFELRANVARLKLQRILLSSVRVLRDYAASRRVPAGIEVGAARHGAALAWSRDRLDGAPGYRLSMEGLNGTRLEGDRIASASGTIHVRVRALTGEPPLTALGGAALLEQSAAAEARERDVLSFLSYREKYLAGSWRFDTYFGRDTLMTLRLLAPVLTHEAGARAIDSVLERLSAQGEVAHEEAIGEYAVLLNAATARGPSAAPVYDYRMIDEDFLLAPVAADWLLDRLDRGGAVRFLAGRDGRGELRGEALLRNLRFVVRRTAAFARAPQALNLIGLKSGARAGDWRDSAQGLDGGTYPYDVNVALVPAALAAIDRLGRSGLLQPFLRAGDSALASAAASQYARWQQAAPPLFAVRVSPAEAAVQVRRCAMGLGVDPAPALAAVKAHSVAFDALALDAAGRALPVMQSDSGFALLLGTPGSDALERVLALLEPFPAGLLTPAGLLVANPAYADPATQARFTAHAYHGTVIWGWQEALLAAGLDRQLARTDLPALVRSGLERARERLWRVIDAGRAFRGTELWSWRARAGRIQAQPFQGDAGDVEADAAQLWSTVFLALRPPWQARAPNRYDPAIGLRPPGRDGG